MIINTVNIDLTWHEDYLIVFLIKLRSEDQANISREMSSDVSSLLSGFTFYFGFGLSFLLSSDVSSLLDKDLVCCELRQNSCALSLGKLQISSFFLQK